LTQVQVSSSSSAPPAAWPLHSQLELGALPGAVPCARVHSRLVLWEWGQAGLGETVELVVSELMTNALRASVPGAMGWSSVPDQDDRQVIGVRLASDGRQVLVEVWDSNPAPPVAGLVNPDGETGRGLLMVQRLSSRWGYYYLASQPDVSPLGDRAVKVVWALITPRPWG
jgi:Histidine kinase-like ATPase domain